MTEAVHVPGFAVGALAGAALFLLLTGGRLPWPRRRVLSRALTLRWLGLGAKAGLEEAIWRGLVLGGLAAAIGPAPGLVLSSLGFALWHLPALGARCGVHVVTGATFGTACLASGITAAIVAHATYNILVDWAVRAERARPRGP